MQNINVNNTSFHDGYVIASCNEIKKKLQDKPKYIKTSNDPTYSKVHIEFVYQLENGIPFTIYDYKEYNYSGENLDVVLEFHVGTHTKEDTIKVLEFLKTKNLKTKYDPFNF